MTLFPSNPRAGPRGQLLLDLVNALGIPYGFERSLRLCQDAIYPNRFLVSLAKPALKPDPDRKVLDLCQRLGMPPHLMTQAQADLPSTRFIHLGYEEDGAGQIHKLYLESGIPPGKAFSAPLLLHLAYKWDPAAPDRAVVSKYLWYPGLTPAGIQDRLNAIYVDPAFASSAAVAADILRLAAGRVRSIPLRYMEVAEATTVRRSFDLNLYDARLQCLDLLPLLARMCTNFRLAPSLWQPVFQSMRSSQLGHVAGGIHRHGQNFFNIYYGVEARHG